MKRHLKRTKWLVIAATLAVHANTPIGGSTADTRMGPVTWSIDGSRSEARFTVTKLGFENVTGVFRESDGEIRYDPDRPQASSVNWRVRVASVVTDASNRDRALQGREYFDAERHPYLEFTSTAVRQLDDRNLEVSGRLTMRGVTRPLVTVVRQVMYGASPKFEAAFEVDRYDFGIAGGSIMGRLIGRKVTAAVVLWPAPSEAQDVEYLRALERAQREKPVRVTSRERIAPAGEPGQPLIIRGRLFRGDGRTPASGITVFAYHTDRAGLYHEPSKGPHVWRLRGWAVTDIDGRLVFDTIRPAPYPGRGIPAHVHLSFEGPGVPRQSAEVLFSDDPIVTAAERAASAKDGIFGSVRTVRMRDGAQEIDVNLRITLKPPSP